MRCHAFVSSELGRSVCPTFPHGERAINKCSHTKRVNSPVSPRCVCVGGGGGGVGGFK